MGLFDALIHRADHPETCRCGRPKELRYHQCWECHKKHAARKARKAAKATVRRLSPEQIAAIAGTLTPPSEIRTKASGRACATWGGGSASTEARRQGATDLHRKVREWKRSHPR